MITESAKAWVVRLACSKPKEFSQAAEVWTRNALAQHVRQQAVAAGYPSLARAAKATVQRILAVQPLHPEKVTYYLERRDPDFEAKTEKVLLVHQEVALQNQAGGGLLPIVVTVSVDEKPGLPAIANTSPDLPPGPDKYPTVGRDHEYGRLGTCSILAALDLHDGHVTARVERRHRSREFIALLKDSDRLYPSECTIGVHDSPGTGQPFRAPFEGNAGVFSRAAQSVQVCAHSETRIVAQHCRDTVRKDEPHISAAHQGAILGGATPPSTERRR